MPKGETSTASTIDRRPKVVPSLDNTQKVEQAYQKGRPKRVEKKELTEDEKKALVGEYLQAQKDGDKEKILDIESRIFIDYGQTPKKLVDEVINRQIEKDERQIKKDERATNIQNLREAIRGVTTTRNKKSVDDVLINDTPSSLPQSKTGTSIPPTDIKLAALAARTDATPKPAGLWGKFKSLFTTSRDERASAKFSEMQADTDETPADRRAAIQGEKMMEKAESPSRHDFKTTMKEGDELAETGQLKEEAIKEEVPGPKQEIGRKNMEALNKEMEEISTRLQELRSGVESIKLSWFSHLKINKEGLIVNLPENNENVVLDFLSKQKQNLEAKNKTEEAEVIGEQMHALHEYGELLTRREKLKAESGQDLME